MSLAGTNADMLAPLDPGDLERAAGAVDPDFYTAQGEIGAVPPALHFALVGWREGRAPRAAFEHARALASNPADLAAYLAAGGLDPAPQRARHGGAEIPHRSPSPRGTPAHLHPVAEAMERTGGRRAPGPFDPNALDIHWLIPDFAPGGGGHATIFRMIRLLEMAGHRNTIWIEARRFHMTAASAHDDMIRHFACVAAEVRFLSPAFYAARGDAVIATSWPTAWSVAATTSFAERFYFVQDHEPDFHPRGGEALLAEATYDLDLACLCAGPWLARLMRERGRWAESFDLAFDPAIYHPPDAPPDPAPVRIALYARSHTERRATSLALMALDRLAERGLPVEVHLFGDANAPTGLPYPAVRHGVLDPAALAQLYRRCHIGLCFSATNPSLVPQEMMACGLPVMELAGASTRAFYPEGIVTFAPPDPIAIANRLAAMIRDPSGRQAQARRARAWVAQFGWEGAAAQVAKAIAERLTACGHRPNPSQPQAETVDVVIPTLNGMDTLPGVIAALRAQKGRARPNVICIDSGSTDGTAEWLARQPDVDLVQIANTEFQHGRTRNLGAARGTAPLIAFLTQDAEPLGTGWLHDLWAMMTHHPDAAGVFGRHVARPGHPPLVRRDTQAHFDWIGQHPLHLTRHTGADELGLTALRRRQLLHFYSNNNSCLRRVVWQQIPFPEVSYGEDQLWAEAMVAAGHAKLYAPTAAVLHSHDYTTQETRARARVEGAFFRRAFGYRTVPRDPLRLRLAIRRARAEARDWLTAQGQPDTVIAAAQDGIEARYLGLSEGQRRPDRY